MGLPGVSLLGCPDIVLRFSRGVSAFRRSAAGFSLWNISPCLVSLSACLGFFLYNAKILLLFVPCDRFSVRPMYFYKFGLSVIRLQDIFFGPVAWYLFGVVFHIEKYFRLSSWRPVFVACFLLFYYHRTIKNYQL